MDGINPLELQTSCPLKQVVSYLSGPVFSTCRFVFTLSQAEFSLRHTLLDKAFEGEYTAYKNEDEAYGMGCTGEYGAKKGYTV